MKAPIDVSRGQQVNFAANGNPVTGIITGSGGEDALYASITVEIETLIPNGAQLTIPGLDCGGCGTAHPVNRNGRVTVALSVPYRFIHTPTIGK